MTNQKHKEDFFLSEGRKKYSSLNRKSTSFQDGEDSFLLRINRNTFNERLTLKACLESHARCTGHLLGRLGSAAVLSRLPFPAKQSSGMDYLL